MSRFRPTARLRLRFVSVRRRVHPLPTSNASPHCGPTSTLAAGPRTHVASGRAPIRVAPLASPRGTPRPASVPHAGVRPRTPSPKRTNCATTELNQTVHLRRNSSPDIKTVSPSIFIGRPEDRETGVYRTRKVR